MNAIRVGYSDRIGWLFHLKATFAENQAIYNRQCKKWKRAIFQIELLNSKIDHLQRRYNCAVQAERQDFCDSFSLQLTTVKGVREMFLKYRARLADELISLRFERRALVDLIEMLKRYSIEGIIRYGINPVVGQVPRHLGSYSLVAAMDPPSPEANAALNPSQSPEATIAHRPSPEAASTHRPSPEAASTHRPSPEAASTHRPSPEVTSTHRPCPEAASTHRPSPEAASTHRPSPEAASTHRLFPEVTSTNGPCPEGEGSDGGWSTVQRRKKSRQQPNQQDRQSE